jgi:hypothetical protein
MKRPHSCPAGDQSKPVRKRDPKLEKFLERQKTGPMEMRRAASLLQRSIIESGQQEYDVAFWGAHGADGFRKKLISVYGCLSTAWRSALDKEDKGKLSFAELCKQCHEIGFGGNLKKVWKELDTDEDGFITLMDLDSDAHKAIAKFMNFLLTKYGSTIQAWRQALAPNGREKLEEKEFVERCATIGYDRELLGEEKGQQNGDDEDSQKDAQRRKMLLTQHARKLFRLLRVDPHNKCITLKEIDLPAYQALRSGDPCAEALSEGDRRSSASRNSEPRCFSRQGARTMMDTIQTDQLDHLLESAPSSSPSNAGAVSSTVGRRRPNELQMTATLKINEALDGDRPGSSQGLAKSASDSLTSPMSKRQHLGAVTPTRNMAWIRELSVFQRSGMMEKKQTQEKADKGVKTVAELRRMLKERYGSMLTAWRQALDPHDKGHLSFPELCEALRCVGYTGSLKACFEELQQNKRKSLEEFDPRIEDFDPNLTGSNALKAHFEELQQKRKKRLEESHTGFITLKDLDPRLGSIIDEYKDLVRQKYGNLLNGWVQALDKYGKGCADSEVAQMKSSQLALFTDEATFVEHCKFVGFNGDAKGLFRTFKTDMSTKMLPVRDWDIRASRALMRGDTGMITEEHKEVKTPQCELTFNERQETSFHQRWARFQSTSKIADLQATWEEARDADVAAGDLKTLKQALKRKYGTLASAWRRGLDPEGLSQLPFNEFAVVLRKQGFSGNVRALWHELHAEGEGLGFVTLASFDAEADAILGSFRAQLIQRYGDIISAWLEGIDPHGTGRLEEADFVKRFKQLGLEGDARKVFANLQERGRTFIILKDIEPRAVEAVYRGDHKAKTLNKQHRDKQLLAALCDTSPSPQALEDSGGLTTTAPSDGDGESPNSMQGTLVPLSSTVTSNTRLSEWSAELGKRMRQETTRQHKEEREKWMGCTSLDAFRSMLVERYGSIVSAWRSVLDADGNGRVSFNEFCKGCRSLSYNGNVEELWSSLRDAKGDAGEQYNGQEKIGHVELEVLDPEAANRLRSLRDFFLGKYECILDAWEQCLDPGKNLWLDEDEFFCKLKDAGYDPGGKKQCHLLFLSMMPDKASRHLHVEDLQTVLIGVPNINRRVLWMGQKKPPPLVGHHDPEGRPLEVLKGVLVKNFGSVYTGWWRGVDVSRTGRVSMTDFKQAALTIGYPGNMNALVRSVKPETEDFVTLKDIDTGIAAAVDEFDEKVKASTYGSFNQAWLKRLASSGSDYVEEQVFLDFCAEIGCAESASALFRIFNPVPGRFYLFYEDFGPCSLAPKPRGASAREAKSPNRLREAEAPWRQNREAEALRQTLRAAIETTPVDATRLRRVITQAATAGIDASDDLLITAQGVFQAHANQLTAQLFNHDSKRNASVIC